jgi:NADPH:quinone reductase-like Zn-dependent oxidoreductase
VGHLTVQLAARAGARVTAHVRSNRTQLIEAGADRVLCGEEPQQGAFDVVLDGVGGASLEQAIRAIRPDGTIVLFGATDQQPANITLLDFIGHEGARILTYFSYASGGESSIATDLATLGGLVARGRLRPAIGTVVDWHRADRALRAFGSGEATGKTVLAISANGHP